jgi:tetratricopeptide (TPR) repeat protein
VLWLDADDRVPEKAGQLIAAALRNPGPKMHNRKCFLSFQVEDVGPDGRVRQRFNHPRLFPRLPGMEWVGRIHESFVPAAMALGLEEVPTDITIQHTGYASPAILEAKARRNESILLREPESPAKYWNLGNSLGMVGRWEEALAAYCWALETPWDEPLNPVFRDQLRYVAARALFNLGRIEDMDAFLDGSGHPDAFFMAGRLHEHRGDRMRAIEHFRHYLDYTAQPFFWPYDTDAPTLRPAAYAGMLTLMEAEFNARAQAFAVEYPELAKVAEA